MARSNLERAQEMTREALEGLGEMIRWDAEDEYTLDSDFYNGEYGPKMPTKNEKAEQKRQVVARLKSALLMLGVDLK